jgi:hypothetical protein
MVTTNQATEMADQFTAIETRSLNQSAAGKPGAVSILLIFLVIVVASTATTQELIQDYMSATPQGSMLVSVVVYSIHILFTSQHQHPPTWTANMFTTASAVSSTSLLTPESSVSTSGTSQACDVQLFCRNLQRDTE